MPPIMQVGATFKKAERFKGPEEKQLSTEDLEKLKEIIMIEVSKKEFDALKKELEGLKKSHFELIELLMKLTDGLRRFAQTERELDKLSKETLSERRRVYHETFNDVYLKISNLKNR